ncbi:MAG: class II glutamine amidotransferase, partial [Ruminococcus sp.]|nr:class II glutamine amidotransferase [Ruminococcus sp.]
MCELFGASLKENEDISGYLSEFFSHGVQHPHGWGIYREHHGDFEIVKEAISSIKSVLAKEIARTTEPQKHFMAHIRLATAGAVKTENCHPFSGFDTSCRRWTLIHNGTIYAVNRTFPYRSAQHGNTDSERVFLYLLDKLNKVRPSNESERFAVADEVVQELSEHNKLNLLISDGEILYVHKNMEGTLFYLKTDNGYYFSTKPLGNGVWTEFPTAQLIAFQNGEKLFSGTNHGKIFTSVMH